jgi:hypothetical protein
MAAVMKRWSSLPPTPEQWRATRAARGPYTDPREGRLLRQISRAFTAYNTDILPSPVLVDWCYRSARKLAWHRERVRRAAVSDVRSIKKVIYKEVSDFKESGAGILSANKREQDGPLFDNYELDWQVLYSDLMHLIRLPKILHKLDRGVVVHGFKGDVKKMLHTLTYTVVRDKV